MPHLMKVSDAIARLLKEYEVRYVFGIIGSANAHIFDSIQNLGYTQIVCVHHEQAATIAMQTYYRCTGKVAAALVTAGGGSANAITGVMSAWADSIPGVVISGQENVRFINQMSHMRMWGIQGYDSIEMVRTITKYQVRVMEAQDAIFELEKSFHIAMEGRPGPVWVDFPMNIQGTFVDESSLKRFTPCNLDASHPSPIDTDVDEVESLIRSSERPVFWLGHGIRLSGGEGLIRVLLQTCQVPTLLSWAGIDMLEEAHPLNFGQAGVYGMRAANFVLQNADLVIAIGNRMAIPMIGYEHAEFAREAKTIQVDIDPLELEKTKDIADLSIVSDAKKFINSLINRFHVKPLDVNKLSDWLATCIDYRRRYPRVGSEHADTNGYINSYRVIDRLSDYFKADQCITTDMGTALLSGHQAIRLKRGQRLMTSTGLGEMGYGLPAAIGASFARDRGEVICLNCDGGMMMNLQELQTIAHYQLPIKLFIFNNDGYLMIKHTQKNLFKGRYAAVNSSTGVTCPDFGKIAGAFDIPYFSVKTWQDFEKNVGQVFEAKSPVICDVFMDPEQYFYPKLSLAVQEDGSIISPPLEDLSPLLPREELRQNMLIGMHEKSQRISN